MEYWGRFVLKRGIPGGCDPVKMGFPPAAFDLGSVFPGPLQTVRSLFSRVPNPAMNGSPVPGRTVVLAPCGTRGERHETNCGGRSAKRRAVVTGTKCPAKRDSCC